VWEVVNIRPLDKPKRSKQWTFTEALASQRSQWW